MSLEQQNAQAAPAVASETLAPLYPPTAVWKPPEDEEPYMPLWLITFADIMALSLTFFVMLYAMSNPKQDKFEDMAHALETGLSEEGGAAQNMGAQDAIQLMGADYAGALNLRYLMTMLEESRKRDPRLSAMTITLKNQAIAMNFPMDTLFEPGGQKISLEGKKVLFALVDQLSRVNNRIEIIGTDPERAVSLSRVVETAAALANLGYDKTPLLRAQIDPAVSALEIWIMPDNGKLRGFLRLGT